MTLKKLLTGFTLASALKGYMIVSHKTGSEFISLDPRDLESIRRADRVNRRAR